VCAGQVSRLRDAGTSRPLATGGARTAIATGSAPWLRHPLRPPCAIQGGDFRPTGGGGFGLVSEATWRLSPSFPLPICLFLSPASLAWRWAARAYSRSARYACLLCAQVWLRAGVVTYDVAAVCDAEKCCPDCAAGVCKMCKIHVIIHVHTFPPIAFTRTSTPYTHTRIQSVTEHRLRGKTRVREQRREAVEGEMAWRARRDAPLNSSSTPRFGHLRALGAHMPGPAHLKRRATELHNSGGIPTPQRRATSRQTGRRQQQLGAEEGGRRCSLMEAFASMGPRVV
jgi:hypothetical protein